MHVDPSVDEEKRASGQWKILCYSTWNLIVTHQHEAARPFRL